MSACSRCSSSSYLNPYYMESKWKPGGSIYIYKNDVCVMYSNSKKKIFYCISFMNVEA
jgi:hypothetical protein